jgi:hypothetical protein
MKSAPPGKRTSVVEVSSLGPDGFWLLLDGRELFVPFKKFPWFQDARIREIMLVERPSPHHLRWPDLDRPPEGAKAPRSRGTSGRSRGSRPQPHRALPHLRP